VLNLDGLYEVPDFEKYNFMCPSYYRKLIDSQICKLSWKEEGIVVSGR
jgi:hypothetical protein